MGWNYVTANKVISALKKANGDSVTVKINSGGGSVYEASEIYSELKNYKGEVTIELVGLVASAASVVSMARKSVMSPLAQFMMHNVSVGNVAGDYRVMQHTAEVLKSANDTIANAYMSKSGMSREEVLKLMNNETWISAHKAKELGLVDEVMFEDNSIQINDITNFEDMQLYNSYTSIPKELLNKIKDLNINNQSFITNSNKSNTSIDFFLKEKAQSELELLKLKHSGGKNFG